MSGCRECLAPGYSLETLFREAAAPEFDKGVWSNKPVTVRTITRRQLAREASATKNIAPGESVQVPDENGGLLITRRKRHALTPAQMMAELDALPGKWPAVDTDKLMEDES